MELRDNLFQPFAFGEHPSSSQTSDRTYYTEIHNFLEKMPTDAVQAVQDLLIPFFNNVAAGHFPLWDKERFYILRAIFKIPRQEWEKVLFQAEELSLGRASQDIIEALCIIGRHSSRSLDNYSPNQVADLEYPLANNKLRDLIYRALICISDRGERLLLARYFLVCKEQQKEDLAQSILFQTCTTGIFILETALSILEFKGCLNKTKEASNPPKPYRFHY